MILLSVTTQSRTSMFSSPPWLSPRLNIPFNSLTINSLSTSTPNKSADPVYPQLSKIKSNELLYFNPASTPPSCNIKICNPPQVVHPHYLDICQRFEASCQTNYLQVCSRPDLRRLLKQFAPLNPKINQSIWWPDLNTILFFPDD